MKLLQENLYPQVNLDYHLLKQVTGKVTNSISYPFKSDRIEIICDISAVLIKYISIVAYISLNVSEERLVTGQMSGPDVVIL